MTKCQWWYWWGEFDNHSREVYRAGKYLHFRRVSGALPGGSYEYPKAMYEDATTMVKANRQENKVLIVIV